MNKRNKWASGVALSALAYFRMVLTIASLIAWSEREWAGLVLVLIGYGISTVVISKVLDTPTEETIKELTELIKELARREE